jgi:hypothetical protein
VAGHDVTAVVCNPNKLSGEAVGIVTADLAAADPAVLESAVADAVLSGLGPRSTSETCPGKLAGVYRSGNHAGAKGYFMSPGAVHRISYGAAARKRGSHAQGD